MRCGRVIAVVLIAILMVALVGGCSSGSSPSGKELAAQDAAVQAGNRLDFVRAMLAEVERRLARQRQAAELLARGPTPITLPPNPAVLQAFGFTPDTLCAPIRPHGTGKEQQRKRHRIEHRRELVLYYLNLACPST